MTRSTAASKSRSPGAGKKSTRVYRWTRDLHLVLGLAICPYVLVFAITTIQLNHRWGEGRGPADEVSTAAVELSGDNDLERAHVLADQLGLEGELHWTRLDREKRFRLTVTRPAATTTVDVDLRTRTAEIRRIPRTLSGTLIYLHFNPGPHKTHGVNWIFSKLWRWCVDTTVLLLLFATVSGVYLWTVIRAQRRTGLILLGAGGLTFVLLLVGLV